MKLALALALLVVTPLHARADAARELMQVLMRCPAISADGKHVAIYSLAPGDDKASKTSLVVFGATGKVEQRIGVVPPATDAARAEQDAAKVVKILDDGGYKRMGRMASKGGKQAKTSTIDLSSEDAVLALEIANRKVTITGTRGGKAIAPIKLALPAKDGPCTSSDSFTVATAGYDKASGLLAFSVSVFTKDTSCFAHDYVVTVK